jgi:hypothetical protein
MINDNAPALSKKTSTKDRAIQDSSVEKQIALQESIIIERQQSIVDAEKTILSAHST